MISLAPYSSTHGVVRPLVPIKLANGLTSEHRKQPGNNKPSSHRQHGWTSTTLRACKDSVHRVSSQSPLVKIVGACAEFPSAKLIDSDPYVYIHHHSSYVCRGDSKNRLSSHFKRVIKYARPSDYAAGAASTIAGPGLLLLWERIAPSHVGKGGFAPVLRLTTAISAGAGFLLFYNRSIRKAGFFLFILTKKSYNLLK